MSRERAGTRQSLEHVAFLRIHSGALYFSVFTCLLRKRETAFALRNCAPNKDMKRLGVAPKRQGALSAQGCQSLGKPGKAGLKDQCLLSRCGAVADKGRFGHVKGRDLFGR